MDGRTKSRGREEACAKKVGGKNENQRDSAIDAWPPSDGAHFEVSKRARFGFQLVRDDDARNTKQDMEVQNHGHVDRVTQRNSAPPRQVHSYTDDVIQNPTKFQGT